MQESRWPFRSIDFSLRVLVATSANPRSSALLPIGKALFRDGGHYTSEKNPQSPGLRVWTLTLPGRKHHCTRHVVRAATSCDAGTFGWEKRCLHTIQALATRGKGTETVYHSCDVCASRPSSQLR
eukprot:4893333-Amphidinium_carterae.1